LKGKLHIYCGDGKGKTTAALGLSLRALGRGFNIIFVQFLKSRETGEFVSLGKMENVIFLREDIPEKFTWSFSDEEKLEVFEKHNALFAKAVSLINELDGDILLVFDEIIGALNKALIDKDMVMEFLQKGDLNAEIVLTGRNPSSELIDIADYVSKVKKIKHPFDNGLKARKGIEK